MNDDVVIWSVPCRNGKYRLGCSNATCAPLPFGAEVIVRVNACDKQLMWRWIRRRIKRGWSPDKIRAACR